MASWVLPWSRRRRKSVPGQLAPELFHLIFFVKFPPPPPPPVYPSLLLARGQRGPVSTVVLDVGPGVVRETD